MAHNFILVPQVEIVCSVAEGGVTRAWSFGVHRVTHPQTRFGLSTRPPFKYRTAALE